MATYSEDAKSDAISTVQNFMDEIVEKIIGGEEVSDDLNNDYVCGDSYHHESHVDREYDLQEAAELLDELSNHEETDSGLWGGLKPRKAISAQAAYTYGNAVYSEWRDLIKAINEDDAIEAIRDNVAGSDCDQEALEKVIESRIKAILSENE